MIGSGGNLKRPKPLGCMTITGNNDDDVTLKITELTDDRIDCGR
jgi:hypothetical protein